MRSRERPAGRLRCETGFSFRPRAQVVAGVRHRGALAPPLAGNRMK